MPQLILEHSSNIIEKNKLIDLLKTINQFMSDSLPTQLSSCKSRAAERNVYCVGDGDQNQAFVHINLKVKSGRKPEKLNDVGNQLMNILKQYFHESAQQLKLQISLEIEELQKTYFEYALANGKAHD